MKKSELHFKTFLLTEKKVVWWERKKKTTTWENIFVTLGIKNNPRLRNSDSCKTGSDEIQHGTHAMKYYYQLLYSYLRLHTVWWRPRQGHTISDTVVIIIIIMSPLFIIYIYMYLFFSDTFSWCEYLPILIYFLVCKIYTSRNLSSREWKRFNQPSHICVLIQ